jgi:type II secretory pathway component GspD/PulD (secretin)
MKTMNLRKRAPVQKVLLSLLGWCLFAALANNTSLWAQRGGQTGGGGRGSTASGPVNTRVIAVADEQSNSLIVSVPDDVLPMVEDLINKLDQRIADVTELKVFTLKNADPQEMADLLASLFPDETSNNNSNNAQQQFRFGGPFQFGPGGGGRGGGRGNAGAAQSERMKKMGKVVAVADARTSSLIVSAASELMPQIEKMIEQLDSSSARKQNVYVYSLENADPQQMYEILQEMFQRTTTSTANRNSLNQSSALSSRIQSNNQQISTGQANNSGIFGSGIGGTGPGGGGGNQTLR